MRLGIGKTEDATLAAALDDGLDTLSKSTTQRDETNELGALLATARQVQTVDASATVGHVRPLGGWAEIARQAGIPKAAPPKNKSSRVWSGRWPRFGELATAAVVLAVLAAGVFGTGLIERDRRNGATGSDVSILFGSESDERLYPLDPMTLTTLPGSFPPMAGTPNAAEGTRIPQPVRWTASPDGSTIAAIPDAIANSTITIYDAATGAVRSTFREYISNIPAAFNADGSLLVLTSQEQLEENGKFLKPAEWFVYETLGGQRRIEIVGEGVTLVPNTAPLVDPSGQTFYVLALADDWMTTPAEQTTLRVLGFDMSTGRIVGETPIVFSNLGLFVQSAGSVAGYKVAMEHGLGWAMSSDGAIISVVDGFGGTLWSVDPATMASRQTAFEPKTSSSQVQTLTGCETDAQLTLVGFTFGGHVLYVGGSAFECISPTELVFRSLGVVEVDLDTDTHRSTAAPDGGLMILPQQPDADNIYASKIGFPDKSRMPPSGDLQITEPLDLFLVRIDADSLKVEAVRTLEPGYSGIVIVPGTPKVE